MSYEDGPTKQADVRFPFADPPDHVMPHVVLERAGTNALLSTGGKVSPFVIAYGYDETSGTWSQGHYFSSLADAEKTFRLDYAPPSQDPDSFKRSVELPERVFPNDAGGFTYIYWNEQHCDPDTLEPIGCLEIHEITALDVVECYEAATVGDPSQDFFSDITGYIHAFSQSSWVDATFPTFAGAFQDYLLRNDGYTFYSDDDMRCIVPMLYENAKTYLEREELRETHSFADSLSRAQAAADSYGHRTANVAHDGKSAR